MSTAMMEGAARYARGVSVDLKVGESVTLSRDGEPPITVTIQEKSGQRSRVRIQAAENVLIGRPEKKSTALG